MSEITKLYENAEVNKQIPKVCSSNELYCKECEAHIEDAMPYCKNAEYPPFTAEKQIELIKIIEMIDFIDEFKIIYNPLKNEWILIIITIIEFKDPPRVIGGKNEKFEQSLAMLVNNLWKDLTPDEKQQVKGILE